MHILEKAMEQMLRGFQSSLITTGIAVHGYFLFIFVIYGIRMYVVPIRMIRVLVTAAD